MTNIRTVIGVPPSKAAPAHSAFPVTPESEEPEPEPEVEPEAQEEEPEAEPQEEPEAQEEPEPTKRAPKKTR